MNKIIFKNKNKYSFLFFVLLTCLFAISVGYAAMNRTLNITGNSEVKQNTWDIHFENIQVRSGSVVAEKTPVIENGGLSVDFNVMLNLPGDFYEFTVDVVNSGSIDAMIESITKIPELTEEQKKYINYIIEYQNGIQIASKQLVSIDNFVRVKVSVEYRTDLSAEDLPISNDVLNLGFTLNYVQADSFKENVKDNGVLKISADGSLDEIGTIVTIGTEQFYTIGTDGNNVKLLAMYNLYVGNECKSSSSDSCTPYGDEITGMQDKNMLGMLEGVDIRKGTVDFSSNDHMGSVYSDYNGSIIKDYVDAYKELLERKMNIVITEARLISHNELSDRTTFYCVSYEKCSNKYPWIYSTSYWTMSALNDVYIRTVHAGGKYLNQGYPFEHEFGVRPVIVISKDYFE